jgi:hypothetical protein
MGPIVTSIDTFSLNAAFQTILHTTRESPIEVSVSSRQLTASGRGTITESALSASTFSGRTVQVRNTLVNATVFSGQQSSPFIDHQTVYLDSSLLPVGTSSLNYFGAGGTTYQTTTVIAALPTAAKVGDTGSFLVVESFSNAAKTIGVSADTITWELLAETASTAVLKFITIESSKANYGTTTIQKFRITSTGEVTRLQISRTNPGLGESLIYDFPREVSLPSNLNATRFENFTLKSSIGISR